MTLHAVVSVQKLSSVKNHKYTAQKAVNVNVLMEYSIAPNHKSLMLHCVSASVHTAPLVKPLRF